MYVVCCRLPSKREILKGFKQLPKKKLCRVSMKKLNYIYLLKNNMIVQKYVIKNLLRPTFSLEDERSY